MRGAVVVGLVLALALPGCPEPAPPTIVARPDTGPFFFDAGPPSDAGSLDAFSWPDVGPPLPAVIPRQSWMIECSVGSDSFVVTLAIDARAESGIVRAVGGAGGRAASVIFDILPGGTLQARSPVPMGLPGDHSCSYDQVTIDQWILEFDDPDGDGIADRLATARSGTTVTRTGPTMPPPGFPSPEFVFVRDVRGDATPPHVTLGRDAPIPGFDPIVVVADEPLEPAFMPRLVGARSYPLAAEIGASAPSRWSIDATSLPLGHYSLVLGTARDLAGLEATTLPTLELDVTAPTTPGIDGVDAAHVTGLLSPSPPTILGDDAGETALAGSTSLLLAGRTVLVLAPEMGRRNLQMTMRLEGPSGATAIAYVTVFDDRGVLVGQSTNYQNLFPPSSVSGFEAESSVSTLVLQFLASRAGPYYALVEPAGRGDLACTGIVPTEGVVAVVDDITVF